MFDLSEEFRSSFGDRRRTERAVQIGQRFSASPQSPFTKIMKNWAELTAFYRFINSSHFQEQETHQAHRQASLKRAEQHDCVLCIHDTTKIGFDVHKKEQVREHLAHFTKKRQGFLCHTSLLVSADALREPLGVVRFQPYIHQNNVTCQEMEDFWSSRGGLFENESMRWDESVKEVEEKVSSSVIHLMDSESDIYRLLSKMSKENQRFIIRHGRERKTSEDNTWEGWEEVEWRASREVTLSERLSWQLPSDQKYHPSREKKTVQLSIKSRPMRLERPNQPPKGVERKEWSKFEKTVDVNAVYIYEEGEEKAEEKLEWMLFTTETIEKTEELLRVVDHYRTRWMIEELFKALKTGCAYEKRQSESAHALLQVLALSWPIAWRLLHLRVMEEKAGEENARKVMSDWEVKLLRELTPKYKWKKKKSTVRDMMRAVAFLGGHYRTEPPGWQILGRGLTQFLEHRAGALAMLRIMGMNDDVYEC